LIINNHKKQPQLMITLMTIRLNSKIFIPNS